MIHTTNPRTAIVMVRYRFFDTELRLIKNTAGSIIASVRTRPARPTIGRVFISARIGIVTTRHLSWSRTGDKQTGAKPRDWPSAFVVRPWFVVRPLGRLR